MTNNLISGLLQLLSSGNAPGDGSSQTRDWWEGGGGGGDVPPGGGTINPDDAPDWGPGYDYDPDDYVLNPEDPVNTPADEAVVEDNTRYRLHPGYYAARRRYHGRADIEFRKKMTQYWDEDEQKWKWNYRRYTR